jgi:hypothetical protein
LSRTRVYRAYIRKEDDDMRTYLAALLILFVSANVSGAWENLREFIFIEEMGAPDEIEQYDSVEYVTGKSQRHFREAWEFEYNEEMYLGQCVNALKDQAILVGANSVLNMSWKLEREYPQNWFTVVCQGLAAWKHS